MLLLPCTELRPAWMTGFENSNTVLFRLIVSASLTEPSRLDPPSLIAPGWPSLRAPCAIVLGDISIYECTLMPSTDWLLPPPTIGG